MEDVRRESFDGGHELGGELSVSGFARCNREAAVRGDDRRDAVETGRRRPRIEGEHRVVVRVGIDDARHRHEAVGVDLATAAVLYAADGGDSAAFNAYVRASAREAGAVHDDRSAHYTVEHQGPPPKRPPRWPLRDSIFGKFL